MGYEHDYKPLLLYMLEDPGVLGWCQPEKAIDLYDRTVELKSKLVVEIGVFGGKSLLALGLGAKKVGDCKAIGIDSWKFEDVLNEMDQTNKEWWASQDLEMVYRSAGQAMHKAMLHNIVQLIRKNSVDALPNIPDSIDVLHIDGNHSEWDSTRDVLNWVPKVRSGGYIYMDDEDWETTGTAQKFLAKHCDEVRKIKTTNVCGVYQKR